MAVGNTPISGLPQAGALTGAELVPVVSNGVTSQVTVESLRGGTVTKGMVLLLSDLAAVLGNFSNPGIYSIAAEVAAGQTVPVEAGYFSVAAMQDSFSSPALIVNSLPVGFDLSWRTQINQGQLTSSFSLWNTSLVPLTFNYVITFQAF